MGAAALRIEPFEPHGEPVGCLTVFRQVPAGRLPGAARDAGFVAILLAGSHCRVRQHGRLAALGPGEWTLYAPQALAQLEGAAAQVIFLPRQALGSLPALDRFGAEAAVNRLTFAVLSAVCTQGEGATPSYGHAAAQAAIHLLETALVERAGRRHHDGGLFQRAKAHLEWRLRDPELSLARLARAMGCTERSVQRAFQGEAETFGRYLLRRRLERCREDLASAALAHQSVTEVAFSWGFNSLAHFSRVFKDAFGQTPSAVRPAARGA